VGELTGADAVRDALEGIDAAFTAAARRRASVVRALVSMTPPPAIAGEHRAVAEALLRREAADAEPSGSPQQRASRVLDEARRARDARARMAERAAGDAERTHVQAVELRHDELEDTWRWALDQADAFAAGLTGRTTPPVAQAVAGYVAAFRAVLAASETLDAGAVARAVAGAEAAAARLDQALAQA
jgi:hypothetical protein